MNCPDHPRACGANTGTITGTANLAGSSPRVRGKLACCGVGAAGCRIIPARAGQTRTRRRVGLPHPDHPRACGANGVWGTFNIRGHGSSPRVRGKHARRGVGGGEARIIPARAGQTCGTSHGIWFHPDHPRACGANGWVALNIACVRGSSPRVRGKLGVTSPTTAQNRIIPARAGQTPAY